MPGNAYYDLTLDKDMPSGSSILDQPCDINIHNADGSFFGPYRGLVFAWHNPRSIRIQTNQLYIPDVPVGGYGVVEINSTSYTFITITTA